MRKFLTALAVGLTLALPLAVAHATPPNPDHKVTLCHRTGSATNPYVVITVDIASSGYVKGGHDQHEQVGNGLGPDIIPAYEYTRKDGTTFSYPGKSLDFVFENGQTGSEVLEAGCVLTQPTPTPTPTETPSPTETPTPTESPTPPPTHGCKRHCGPGHEPKPKPHTTDTAFTGAPVAPLAGGVALLTLTGLWLLRRSRRFA